MIHETIQESLYHREKKRHENWIAGKTSQSALDKTDHFHQNLY